MRGRDSQRGAYGGVVHAPRAVRSGPPFVNTKSKGSPSPSFSSWEPKRPKRGDLGLLNSHNDSLLFYVSNSLSLFLKMNAF